MKSNDDADADADADEEAEAEAELLAEDKASAEWDEEMVPVPVDAGSLADLMEMGFSDVRARKGQFIAFILFIFLRSSFLCYLYSYLN